MRVYVLEITCFIGDSAQPNHTVAGAWREKPSYEEAEAYIREAFWGFVKDHDTGELWPCELGILCYDLRSNIGFHTRQLLKSVTREKPSKDG